MKRSPISFLSQSLLLCLTLLIAVASCRKKDDVSDVKTPSQLSEADSLKYLMYQIMQKTINDGGRDKNTNFPLYFWYDKVPAMDPLSPQYPDAQALLDKMKSFTTGTDGKALDRYSFLDDGSIMSTLQGTAGDFGMEVSYVQDQSGNILLIVTSTDPNSPSGKVGVNRGWVITAINNQSVAWDNGGPNYQRIVNAIYGDDLQDAFSFKKPDGSTQNNTLVKTKYAVNPVLFDTVYSIAGKNVGYFVFNTFTALKDSTGANTLAGDEINRVFSEFASHGITSLIVDLRNNGGGDVATSAYLANKIAPSSLNGKEMYHQSFNNLLNAEFEKEGISNKVNFDGSGSLNLQNVFFISTRHTASSSELLYNNLRPYMNVKLVGDTTYGKPVGQWVMPIVTYPNNVATFGAYLFAISFETLNSDNQGGYFDGLVPDQKATDFVNVPWGNPADDNLEKIFSYLSTGNFGGRFMSPEERMRAHPDLKVPIPNKLPSLRYNGMVDLNQRLILK